MPMATQKTFFCKQGGPDTTEFNVIRYEMETNNQKNLRLFFED